MTHQTLRVVAVVIAAGTIFGCKGKSGAQGPVGTPGGPGPVGPLSIAPVVESIMPSRVTPATKIRIRGNGFSPTAAENTVVLDGTTLTVIGATGTEIWATGAPAAGGGYGAPTSPIAFATVFVNGQTSNAFPVGLGRTADKVLAAPKSGVEQFGTILVDPSEQFAYVSDLYADTVTPDGTGDSYGAIYKYEFATGKLTNVFFDQGYYYISALAFGPDGKLYMGAQNWNTGSVDLYRFETPFDASTVTKVLSGATCSDITQMVWRANGDLWLADTCSQVHVLRKSDGQFFADVFSLSGNPRGLFEIDGRIVAVDRTYVHRLDGVLPFSSEITSPNSPYPVYVSDIYGAATDGTNVIAFRSSTDASVQRVTPGGAVQTLLGGSAFLNNYVSAGSSDPRPFARLKNGNIWFATEYPTALVLLDPSGIVSQEWINPWYGYANYGRGIGSSFFTNFTNGCDYGVGSPIMKQTIDGDVTAIAKDVCGTSNLSVANGLLYAADPRGFVLQIDPVAGTSTVVSANPAIGAADAFATDGTSIFVAQTNTAGLWNIAKIGMGDAAQVDLNFVTNIPIFPRDMIVLDGSLVFAAAGYDPAVGYSYGMVGKVPVAGGAVVTVVPPALGMFPNSLGTGLLGELLFTSNATFKVAAGNVVTPVAAESLYYASPDDFGALSGLDQNYYSYSQVLQ